MKDDPHGTEPLGDPIDRGGEVWKVVLGES